jgi:hypothetical protein
MAERGSQAQLDAMGVRKVEAIDNFLVVVYVLMPITCAMAEVGGDYSKEVETMIGLRAFAAIGQIVVWVVLWRILVGMGCWHGAVRLGGFALVGVCLSRFLLPVPFYYGFVWEAAIVAALLGGVLVVYLKVAEALPLLAGAAKGFRAVYLIGSMGLIVVGVGFFSFSLIPQRSGCIVSIMSLEYALPGLVLGLAGMLGFWLSVNDLQCRVARAIDIWGKRQAGVGGVGE